MVFGKFAALQITHFTLAASFSNPLYLASLGCLALQAVCWPLALRRFPLFWSYLFMSGIYVAIPLISHFVFGEKVSLANAIGAVVIMAGIVLVSLRGGESRDA